MANLCKNIIETFTIVNETKVYDFNKCLDFIEYQGKLHYGQSFKICKDDIPTIYKLIIYMIRDQKVAEKEHLNLTKGNFVIWSNWLR